jgi:hypothetical protein
MSWTFGCRALVTALLNTENLIRPDHETSPSILAGDG